MTNSDAPKHTRHSRGDVIAAALRILDEHGLADLTMRRLAATLDVQPSALYWHFPNKQTLLASVADRIVARAAVLDRAVASAAAPDHDIAGAAERDHATPPAAEQDHAIANDDEWMSGIRAQSDALRDALLSYRDGAEVVSSTLALGLGDQLAHQRLVDAVRAGGFDDRTSGTAASVLLHFILGHVSHEQQRLQADSLGAVADSPDPTETSAPGAFAFGITLLVNGLAVRESARR